MTRSALSTLSLLGLLSLGVACSDSGSDDKSEDEDITDVGDFSDGSGTDDGGSGTGSGDDGVSDDGGGSASGTGSGSGDDGWDDGDDGGEDDGWGDDGGTGTDEPPMPAFELPAVPCEDDLSWHVLMVDSESGSCTSCTYGADQWIVAAVQNPCSTDMQIELYDGYLIGGMDLVNLSTGEGEGMGVGSTGRVDLVVVPAGDFVSEPLYMGRMSRGDYELNLSFNDTEGHSASLAFSVE